MGKPGTEKIQSAGYAAFDKKGLLMPFKFERRSLQPTDVLINILYCGICHSDIHAVRSEEREGTYPMVPGHEIVGKVAMVGSAVKKFKAGDLAGIGFMSDSCHKCAACKAGAEYACPEMTRTFGDKEKHVGGITQGGYSNNIVVDESFALRIPTSMNPAATAPLMCAGITTYTPMRYWKVGPGQAVGVVGLGGLGHLAVKLAKSFGARVTVLTTSASKVQDSLRLGADEAVITTDGKSMKDHSATLDFIIDTVSAKHDIDSILSLLKLNGKMVLVGLSPEPLSVRARSLIRNHRTFAGSGLGGIPETQEMLDYCAAQGISADIELIPIEKVNEAFERVLRGDVKYRFVIDMSSLAK